jgi:hypothetical protein
MNTQQQSLLSYSRFKPRFLAACVLPAVCAGGTDTFLSPPTVPFPLDTPTELAPSTP